MLSSAVERLKACDDAFRKQLEQERQAHEQQIETLTNEKQREIEQANTRVGHDKLYTPRIHRLHLFAVESFHSRQAVSKT